MTGAVDVVFNVRSFNSLSSFFSKEIIAPFGSIQAELDTALSYRNNCLDTKTKQKNQGLRGNITCLASNVI